MGAIMANITRIKAKDDKNSEKAKDAKASDEEITRKVSVKAKNTKNKKVEQSKKAKKIKEKKSSKKNKGEKKVGYFRGAFREIRQVRWPDRKTTWKMTLSVIIYVVAIAAFIMLLDAGLTFIFNNVLGAK